MAGNVVYQYGHSTSTMAINRYAIPVSIVDPVTNTLAETDFTRKPVTMLVASPAKTVGKNRIEVLIGERSWISWKLLRLRKSFQPVQANQTHKSDAKYPNELKAAHVKNTATQTLVKATFLHSEFGMIAGLPLRSCFPTQNTKAGSRARPILRMMILEASFSLDVLAVMTLSIVSIYWEERKGPHAKT